MKSKINTLEEYNQAYKESVEQPEQFWSAIAENFSWKKKWDKVLDWSFNPFHATWFEGAELNITENCLDRHLATKGDDVAFVWEPNNPTSENRTLTYKELHSEVCKTANMLKQLGVTKGDRICIYMPMIPEAAIAMLACARIGAIHSVVFAGFSAQSLIDRINDAACKLVITSDGANRGDKTIRLKDIVDEAVPEY